MQMTASCPNIWVIIQPVLPGNISIRNQNQVKPQNKATKKIFKAHWGTFSHDTMMENLRPKRQEVMSFFQTSNILHTPYYICS